MQEEWLKASAAGGLAIENVGILDQWRTRDPNFLARQTFPPFPLFYPAPLLSFSFVWILSLFLPFPDSMALLENSRQSLVPSFIYSSPLSNDKLLHFDPKAHRNPTLLSASSNGNSSKNFLVPAPSEPRKIELYSPAFYAACTTGGILSCGLTHMAVTPLDLVKCNMQVFFFFPFSFGFICVYISFSIDLGFVWNCWWILDLCFLLFSFFNPWKNVMLFILEFKINNVFRLLILRDVC